MGINIREIAEIANVSPATISLVLNNRDGVSKEKREKIQQILEEYGYKKRPIASNRRGKRDGQKLCILRYSINDRQDICNSELDAHIIDCLHRFCHELDFQESMIVCNESNFKKTLSSLTFARGCGYILIGSMFSYEQTAWLDTLPLHGTPLVVVDNYMMHTHISSVSSDNYNISGMIMRQLKARNVRSVGYLCHETRVPKLCDRERGFYQSIERLGMQDTERVVLRQSPEHAYEDMMRYLKSDALLPEAFYAETGSLAMIAIRALHECGKQIPKDIFLASGDNTLMSSLSLPGVLMTSISYESICRIALSLVRDQLKDGNTSNNAEHIVIAGKLISSEDDAFS